MNELLLDKLEELYNLIDSDLLVKEMLVLKNKIYNDSILKEKLDKYRSIENKYSSEFISLKIDIINNPLIERYRFLENELYFLILEINQKLNTLVDKKGCFHEGN